MLAAQITKPHHSRVATLEPPTPAPHELVIQVKRAGICGTDMHIWHGDYALARYPVIPGHEFAGVVSAVGDQATRFKVGDHVAADPNVPCNRCVPCQRNEQNQCENLGVIGVNCSGAFATHIVVPEEVTFSIGTLSFEAAALVEPLACVVWGLKRVQVQAGDRVLLYGAGPMGCLMLQALKRAGAASVTVVDKSHSRLALADALGADYVLEAKDATSQALGATAPHGFDVVADATGVPAVIEQCVQHVRPRGKMWVFGVAPGDARIQVSPYDLFRKDLSIIGSFALSKTFHEALALIQSGAIQTEKLVSHRVPLEEFEQALDLAQHDPDRMKVQFIIPE